MRRRRKKRNELSVSLFPFLAVLICTLGVLIVMLVMAVKSADDQAVKVQSDDDAAKQAKVDELKEAIAMNQFQTERVSLVRPDALDRLKVSRSNRSYLEDEIRKLKREFKKVGKQLRVLETEPAPSPVPLAEGTQAKGQADLDALTQKIAEAKSDLKTKRASSLQSGTTNYVIVPHKGGGGTFRRPIFIECTKDAIVLQPSGIRLAKNEFVPPLEPGNMLDSALLSVREYWQRYDLAGEEGSPYPLIVVRPDGAETFALARHAMKSWDDEFGYELVESDKSLVFGERDPQLDAEVKDAIDEAKRRQRYQVAQAVALRRRNATFENQGDRPGLTASSRNGGFVSNSSGHGGGNFAEAYNRDESSFVSKASNYVGEGEDRKNDRKNDADKLRSSTSVQKSSSQGDTPGNSRIRNLNANQSLAQSRGANWALPTKTQGATGYVRPIRVQCNADRLELRSTDGSLVTIPMSGPTTEAIDPLVDEIWKLIDSWGVSGANAYWKPQLRISVSSDGKQRYQEIRSLLDQSGLTVQESRQ